MEKFRGLLEKARERTGLTQTELAKKVGINPSYISKIERGVENPPARDKVLAIAEALKITEKTERAYFLLAAGCASGEDLEGLDEDGQSTIPLPFGDEAFHFPQLNQIEENVIIEEIRRLLRTPELSHEQRTECVELIRSFVALIQNPKLSQGQQAEYIKLIQSFFVWLEFRIGENQ